MTAPHTAYEVTLRTDTEPLVIFTKRATSIVGHGHPIYTHPEVTKQVDYEGELGIIIGKGEWAASSSYWHLLP